MCSPRPGRQALYRQCILLLDLDNYKTQAINKTVNITANFQKKFYIPTHSPKSFLMLTKISLIHNKIFYKGEYLSGFEAHWAVAKRLKCAGIYKRALGFVSIALVASPRLAGNRTRVRIPPSLPIQKAACPDTNRHAAFNFNITAVYVRNKAHYITSKTADIL
jgi:hypothetical protein